MCIEGFRGKGYSKEFVENMQNIIDFLKQNPYITPVNFPDDICKKCPNLIDGVCKNEKGGEEDVKRMDDMFYEKTSIALNQNYSYFKIKDIIYEVFKKKSDLIGICDCCSWNRICLWYKTRED